MRATDIDEQIEAHLAPFMWKAILDARGLIAEDLGAAPTPWCSRRWSAKPEGAQPADTRRGGAVRGMVGPLDAGKGFSGTPAPSGVCVTSGLSSGR